MFTLVVIDSQKIKGNSMCEVILVCREDFMLRGNPKSVELRARK